MNCVEFFHNVKRDPKLFVIEGHDFSGKSSVCQNLSNKFHVTRLPGGTVVGEMCRSIYAKHSTEIEPLAMYHVMCAADAQFVKEMDKIEGPILLDRQWLSRICYQIGIHCIPADKVFTDLYEIWKGTLPCKTIMLTCSAEEMKKRQQNRQETNKHDVFDNNAIEVRRQYIKLLASPWFDFNKWCVHIETDNKTIEQVTEEVLAHLNS